jgi:hypothetical protein
MAPHDAIPERARRITIRRGAERRHGQRDEQHVWLTFDVQDRRDPLADGFGSLELLDEHLLPPRGRIPRHRPRAAGILTYVVRGTLGNLTSEGGFTRVQAGEFHYAEVGPSLRFRDSNPSSSDWAHVVRLWFKSDRGVVVEEQKRFSVADRRPGLRLVASSDGRTGSLLTGRDVSVYSALLAAGQDATYALGTNRGAWLHVVHGQALVCGAALGAGDAAGVCGEDRIVIRAVEATDLLLVDVRGAPLGWSEKP